MSATGRALSKALDKPDDWYLPDRFCIKHRPSGMAFWIVNGPFFFDGDGIEGTPRCLGLIERHWLYRKAKKIAKSMDHARRAGAIAKICAALAA